MGGWWAALAAAGFWGGILLEGLGRRGPPMAIAAALVVAGAILLGWAARSGAARGFAAVVFAVVAAFAVMGAGVAGVHHAATRSSPLAMQTGHSAAIEGSLLSDPRPGPLGWNADLSVSRVDTTAPGGGGEVTAVRGSLWIEGHGAMPHLEWGDRVRVTGLLRAPHGPFGAYLRRRGYAATFVVGELHLQGPTTNPVLRAAGAVRSLLRTSVQKVMPVREGGLVIGLALGDTSRIGPVTEEAFKASGLSHLTAVSGENVAMFLAPILGLATWLGLGRRGRFLLGLMAVGFFVLLARAEPSVLRAAFMAGITMLGVFLGRPRSPPAILGAAVLALLALNPTLIYAIGFQLSVAATVGMVVLSGPLSARLTLLPSGLALAVATSIGAQAGVTPLLLYHFGAVPTATLPANLLAFPAVGPGMVMGLLSAAVGLGLRPIGVLIGRLAAVPLGYLGWVATTMARSPLPSITSGQGHILMLGLDFAVVALAAAWVRRGMPVGRRGAMAVALVLPVILFGGAVRAGRPSGLTVTFFYVGWGDGALVRSPGGAAILIDGGPDPELIATKLAALGVRRLDLLVATHPHADHVTGLPAVLARFPVGLVIDPGCPATSPFNLDFLDAVRAAKAPFRHPRAGDRLQVGDVRVDVLGPERCFHATHSDPNNDSLVLRLTQGTDSVLFAGDAEQSNQADLLRDEAGLLPAPVVKWPHHGGDTNLDAFFDAVRARVAIVSTGPNLYGDPAPSVIAHLQRAGIRVYRTDFAGDVTAAFHEGRVTIESGGRPSG